MYIYTMYTVYIHVPMGKRGRFARAALQMNSALESSAVAGTIARSLSLCLFFRVTFKAFRSALEKIREEFLRGGCYIDTMGCANYLGVQWRISLQFLW